MLAIDNLAFIAPLVSTRPASLSSAVVLRRPLRLLRLSRVPLARTRCDAKAMESPVSSGGGEGWRDGGRSAMHLSGRCTPLFSTEQAASTVQVRRLFTFCSKNHFSDISSA